MFVGYESLHDAWDHIEDADGNHLPQTTNRWYESTNGTVLYKVAADGRRSRFAKMQQVVVVNDLPDEFPGDVNYDYYIEEAQTGRRTTSCIPSRSWTAAARKPTSSPTKSARSGKIGKRDRGRCRLADQPDLNYYRDLYTGRVAINAYDSMRDALKALWKSQPWADQGRPHLVLRESSTPQMATSTATRSARASCPTSTGSLRTSCRWRRRSSPRTMRRSASRSWCWTMNRAVARRAMRCSKIVSGGPGKVYWWAINKISPLASERFNELHGARRSGGREDRLFADPLRGKGRGTMKMRIDSGCGRSTTIHSRTRRSS